MSHQGGKQCTLYKDLAQDISNGETYRNGEIEFMLLTPTQFREGFDDDDDFSRKKFFIIVLSYAA